MLPENVRYLNFPHCMAKSMWTLRDNLLVIKSNHTHCKQVHEKNKQINAHMTMQTLETR